MFTGINSYPNPENYPSPSFPQPIPPPDDEPDEGDIILVAYSLAWQQPLLAAVDQLKLLSTWAGTNEEKTLAVNRAANLQYLLTEPAGDPGVPTPYWDDQSDLDDQDTPAEQPWYGIFDGEFHEVLENWLIAGFLAYSGQPGAALTFLTIAPRFRLAWKTGDVGGIIRIFIDGTDAGTVDTYSDTPGVIEQDFIGDPEVDEHQVLMVLEEVP